VASPGGEPWILRVRVERRA